MADEQHGEGAADELGTAPWRPAEAEVGGEPATTAWQPGTRTRVEPGPLSDEQVVSRLLAVEKIERFTVLRVLGEGGMGIVSLAYDEELDRKVALKVIRQSFCDQPEHRRRFSREAKALARLAHPNVVTIYDVGEFCGRLYLAMQYVEGVDLRKWMREASRSQAEVMKVFVDTGRGLAAAHAAGLVHRDIKPANILVGVDGRARIVDFGLSRAPDPTATDDEARRAGDSLTAVGTIIGTPAYMSPEQLLGRGLDARSDQYAFAVVLHEALTGKRPHAGKTVPDRLREGFEVVFPGDSPVPRRIQRVLTRALAELPERRFRTMDELLAALTRDPWRRWRRIATVAATAGAAGLAGYALTGGEPCAGASEQLAAVWSPEARAGARAALAGEGGERVVESLDGYAGEWSAAHHEVCVAHHRGESSEGALDVRMDCLGRARLAFTALAEAVQRPGATDVDAALVAALGLPAVRGWLTLDALASGPPPPSPAIAGEVEALRAKLARAGYGPQGDDAELRAIAARAEALGYRPLAAEALTAIGVREAERAEYEAAVVDLEGALWSTTIFDDPAATAAVLSRLIYVLGDRLDRDDLAARWRAHAEALIERLGPDAPGTAMLLSARGRVDQQHKRFDAALDQLRRAVAIGEARFGADDLRVAEYVGMLASAQATVGQWTAAQRSFERSLAILERAYGPDHGAVVTLLGNLGNVHVKLGDPAKAVTIGQDALVRAVRGHGDEHPLVARAHMNLAQARRAVGQLAQARGDLLEARRIQRARLGAHRELRHTLGVLVPLEAEMGDFAAARFHGEELIGVTLALHSEDAPEVFDAFAEALDVELAAEDDAAALALAERGLARSLVRGLAGEDADVVAYLQFHAARGLRAAGREPARATALAAAAEPLLAAHPGVYPDELAELTAWRRAKARPR